MEVRLLVDHPSAETKQIRLGAETLIGRGQECKLRISSSQVSRRHCVIKVGETVVSIRDLGSSNGTRLNGLPIATETDIPIVAGSTLTIGPLKFIVQFAAPRTAADEDTEWLPELTAGSKSTAEKAAPAATAEETKADRPAKDRRHSEPPKVVIARDEATVADEALDPTAPADAGEATVHDVSIDPGETVFDAALEDCALTPISGAAERTNRANPKVPETHLLFEEDDLRQLVAGMEAAVVHRPSGSGSADADSETLDESTSDDEKEDRAAGGGFLGFLKRKKKPDSSPPAKSPDDNDDLNRFLRDV